MFQCKPPPEGCGREITSFLTEVALDQFKVTGLCEACQLAKARPVIKDPKEFSVEIEDSGPKPSDE